MRPRHFLFRFLLPGPFLCLVSYWVISFGVQPGSFRFSVTPTWIISPDRVISLFSHFWLSLFSRFLPGAFLFAFMLVWFIFFSSHSCRVHFFFQSILTGLFPFPSHSCLVYFFKLSFLPGSFPFSNHSCLVHFFPVIPSRFISFSSHSYLGHFLICCLWFTVFIFPFVLVWFVSFPSHSAHFCLSHFLFRSPLPCHFHSWRSFLGHISILGLLLIG